MRVVFGSKGKSPNKMLVFLIKRGDIVTKKELSQLYHLNREIDHLKKRIEELEQLATSCTAQITGMPHASGISNKTANYAEEIADLKELLDLNIKKCFYELNRLNRFINSIDNSEIRLILSLRYVNGLTWEQVACSISAYATADSVRMLHNRYLKSCSLCSVSV